MIKFENKHMNIYEQLLADTLDSFSNRLKSGSCQMSNEEMMSVMETMIQYDTTQIVSKDQACSIMQLSRSVFDDKVRCGLIPKGQKVRGFKELVWKKCELELAKENICQIENGDRLD